jgi:hypothetical protein
MHPLIIDIDVDWWIHLDIRKSTVLLLAPVLSRTRSVPTLALEVMHG